MNFTKKSAFAHANSSFFTNLCGFLSIFTVGLILVSCRTSSDQSLDVLDRYDLQSLKAKAEKKYFTKSRRIKKKLKEQPSIPSSLKKQISVTITEEVPLKEAIIELAHQTSTNLQLDSKVDKRILFSAKNVPLIDVIKDICEMVDLRYRICGQSVRIQADTPYTVNYSLPFLNLSRTAENRISIATDVFSSIKEGKALVDNGSNSAIIGKGSNDFWSEVDANLKTILQTESKTKQGDEKSSTYSLHRQGGLISVHGTQRQHKLISEYFETLQEVISRQVLIEAKVIEVNLKDQYKSGINWQKLAGGDLHLDIALGDFAQRGRFTDPTSAQTDMLSIGLQGTTFTQLLKAIGEFGASRTLSSPRLTVMNNQTAILKIAQNQVYFRLNYDKQLNLAANRESINVSSDIQTVPIGLVMAVQPSIDFATGDIILSLRPTISRLTHSVSDPAVEIAFANAKSHTHVNPKPSLIPVVEVREIDSVLRLQSGEIAVLGGLMETRTTNGTAKVPIVGDVPILGQLFTSSADSDEVVELVILLRASIIDDAPKPDDADQRLYEDYIDDPRSIEMN